LPNHHTRPCSCHVPVTATKLHQPTAATRFFLAPVCLYFSFFLLTKVLTSSPNQQHTARTLTNGHEDDVPMVDTDSQTPGATPGISGDVSMASIDGSSTSVTRSYPDDSDEHGEPPAKRARILSSDGDMRYTAHVSPYFFTSVHCYGRADLACLSPCRSFLSSLQLRYRFLLPFPLLQVLSLNPHLPPLPLHRLLLPLNKSLP
jgi:hypothetical protein